MKNTLLTTLLILFTVLPTLAQTNKVIYKVNFESPLYTAGIELKGQNGWTEDTANTNWHGYVMNDPTAPDGDNQCVYMECVNGYYHPIDATGCDRTKFSGWFNMLPGGVAGQLEFMYHWSINTAIMADRVNNICYLRLAGTDIHDDANAPLGDWVYASYTIDWTLMQIVEAEFATKKVDLSIDISSSWIAAPVEIHMKSWNFTQANAATKFDDLKVEYVQRQSTAKMGVVPQRISLNNTQTQGVVTVANQGTDTFSYTASVLNSPPWLSLEKTGGTVTSEDTLRFFINRSLMTDDFYRAKLLFDAGLAGSATVDVSAASGTVLYKVNFGPDYYTSGIELKGQDGWTEDTSNPQWFGYVLEDVTAPDGDDQCVYMDCINGYYHPISAAGYDRLKFSGWFNVLPDAKALNLEFMFHWSVPVTIKPDRDLGICYLELPGGTQVFDDEHAALGEWVYASYTVDFNLHQIVEAEFGTVKRKFTDVYIVDTFSNPNQIHMKAWNWDQTNSACKFDALCIKYVEPGGPATLSTVSYKYFSWDESAYSLPLSNLGTSSYDYVITKIDPAPWLSVSPSNGTVVSTAQVNLQMQRSGLASGYYRARLKIDAGSAGVITTLVAASQGTVFYDTTFDNPGYSPGELGGQDAWVRMESYYSAWVTNGVPGSDGACVYAALAGYWDGYQHPIEMPANLMTKVSARLFVPNNGTFDNLRIVTRGFWDRVAESMITISNEMCYLSWYDHPDLEVPPPVPPDQWFDFYFIVDFNNKLLCEVGLGENSVEYTDEYFLNINIDRIQNIAFLAVSTNGIDPAGVCIDNICVEEIPEPVLLGCLLLLSFAAVMTKRVR